MSVVRAVLARLRREPVAVWGVVAAAVVGLLHATGVPASVTNLVTFALPLIGIPVVRRKVSPVDAVKAVVTGKA